MRRPYALVLAVALAVFAAALFLVREPVVRPVEPEASAVDSPARAAIELVDAPSGVARAGESPEVGARAAPFVFAASDRDPSIRGAQGDVRPPDFAAGVIEARVVDDASGRPFVGARVRIGGEQDQRESVTDAEGIARFAEVARGIYAVSAEADRYVPARDEAFVAEARPLAVVELRLAELREVLVRLVDASGRDLALADLGFAKKDVGVVGPVLGGRCCVPGDRFVQHDPPMHRALGGESSEHPFRWRFEVRGRAPACVHVLIGDVVLASQALDPRAAEALIRLDRESIERALPPIAVRVVDDRHGEGVAGARVEFACSTRPPIEVVADDEGRARIDGFVAGEVRIRVRAEGRAVESVAARRPIDAEIVVRVRAARAIEGIVLDGDDVPIADVPVSVYTVDRSGTRSIARSAGTAVTGPGGGFRFEGLRAERYVVRANSARESWTDVDVVALPFDAEAVDCRAADAGNVRLRGVRPRPVFDAGIRR